MKYILTILLLLMPNLAISAQIDWGSIKTLKCKFNNSASFNGTDLSTSSKPFGEDFMIYDSIDLKNKTARMIGNTGTDDLTILEAGEMLTLADRTLWGYWILTSFAKKTDTDFNVVMSRHILIGEKPVYSQNYGICKELK